MASAIRYRICAWAGELEESRAFAAIPAEQRAQINAAICAVCIASSGEYCPMGKGFVTAPGARLNLTASLAQAQRALSEEAV